MGGTPACLCVSVSHVCQFPFGVYTQLIVSYINMNRNNLGVLKLFNLKDFYRQKANSLKIGHAGYLYIYQFSYYSFFYCV